MAEQNKPSAQELLNQITEFENTLAVLQKNVGALKNRISSNREQFGDDVSRWPQL